MNYEDAPIEEVLLKPRTERVNIKSNLNKTQVVASISESGFHCKECNQTFKDSTGYLDHVNSKRHLQNAGLGLRIETSTYEQVEARIEFMKGVMDAGVKEYNLQEQVDKRINEEIELKALRKDRKLEKKKRKLEENRDAEAEFQLDDEVAKMMSVSGFKSSKRQ